MLPAIQISICNQAILNKIKKLFCSIDFIPRKIQNNMGNTCCPSTPTLPSAPSIPEVAPRPYVLDPGFIQNKLDQNIYYSIKEQRTASGNATYKTKNQSEAKAGINVRKLDANVSGSIAQDNQVTGKIQYLQNQGQIMVPARCGSSTGLNGIEPNKTVISIWRLNDNQQRIYYRKQTLVKHVKDIRYIIRGLSQIHQLSQKAYTRYLQIEEDMSVGQSIRSDQ